MIPAKIIEYLDQKRIAYVRHPHPRAVSAQELAASVHVTGYRVAKSVIVDADGRRFIAVLPAAELLDEQRFGDAVGARNVRLVDEAEFDALFPDCEVGAEPPFGALYGLPVVVDTSLADEGPMIVRAGSHEETLEIEFEDFVRIEQPQLAAIGRPFAQVPVGMQPELHV